jgi:hypothetical protein
MACIIIQIGHLFAFPLCNELGQRNSHFVLEGMREPLVTVPAKDKIQQIIRQKGTGKCTAKALGFLCQNDTSMLSTVS